MILDFKPKIPKRIGDPQQGLYYLIKHHIQEYIKPNTTIPKCLTPNSPPIVAKYSKTDFFFNLRNVRSPRHASNSKVIHNISYVKTYIKYQTQISATCLMSKFKKLPFTFRDSHLTEQFALIDTDIGDVTRLSQKQNANMNTMLLYLLS